MAFIDLVDIDTVYNVVKNRGPMIPMDIRKNMGKGDSITIGAALSGLASKGAIKVTNVKIGGSPFYYVSGQENKLEQLYKYLNDKDQRAFHYLKEKLVVKDEDEEPLVRVSLRSIKDFSKKLELNVDGESKLFWRWFLLSESEALNIIRNKDVVQKTGVVKRDEEVEPAQVEEPVGVETESLEPENVEKHDEFDEELETERIEEPITKKEDVEEDVKHVKIETEKQEVLEQSILEDVEDKFLDKLKKFFSENHVVVKKAELIRKGSEYEFIVKFKSPFGEAEYFCKAKSKKNNNDGDLSSAFIQGQMKRLPVIYLTTGVVSKKAKEKLKTDFKGMLIKEI